MKVQETPVYDTCWVPAKPSKVESAPGVISFEKLAPSSKPLGNRMWGEGRRGSAVSGLNLLKYGPQTADQSPTALPVWG